MVYSPPIPEDSQQTYNSIATKVYESKNGKITVGGEEIKPEFLKVLREQAIYLSTSQLYELYIATLKNEASNLALIQSKNFEDVQFAKALWHTVFVIENMVNGLKNQEA